MDWQSIQPFFIWISEHPAWAGLIVFLIALTESLFIVGLVVPGTILMFGVGTLVGTGVLGLQETLFFAFAGAVVGDGLSFWIGRHYHRQFSTIWPIKNNPHYLDRGKTFFKKHGGKSILFGRFVGPIRPVVPAVAGMMGMSVKYFFTLNILSAIAWAPFYLLPGVVFGASIGLASVVGMRLVGLLLVLLVCGILLIWLLRKIVKYIVLRVVSYRVFLFAVAAVFVSTSVFITTKIYTQMNRVSEVKVVSTEAWKTEAFSTLRSQREDLFGGRQQLLNLQWVGDAEAIKQSLLLGGWQLPVALDYRSILFWLKPGVEMRELPHIPQTHRGKYEILTLLKFGENAESAYVLQLWPSELAIKEKTQPLWVGSVTQLSISHKTQWLPYVQSSALSLMDMTAFEENLRINHFNVQRAKESRLRLIQPSDYNEK